MIVIDRFGGLIPRLDRAVLPAHGAVQANDVKLHKGILGAWRKPLPLDSSEVVAAGTKTIFYEPGSGDWLSWTTDVDIHPGPVEDLSAAYRYYLTGDGVPKKFDSTSGPSAWLHMGVPAPAAAASASGGTGSATRVWVYTNVSVFSGIEEESAPSPATTITNWADGNTISLSGMSAVPGANYNVTKRRLYRSSGSAYIFVKEFTGTSTTDNATDASLSGNSVLSTLDYDEPPAGLTGLVPMANGIFAGFVENVLYFCEPYHPHAYPGKYALTTHEPIVGLVPVPQGLYVMTTGNPYFCAGSHSSAMTLERSSKYAPCLSKRSIATDGQGAIYATYNGLAYLTGAAVRNITEGLFTQEEWEAYTPATNYAIYYDERYMYWFGSGDDAACAVFDRSVQDAPLTNSRYHTQAAHIRSDTGKLYIVHEDEIKQFDGDDLNRTPFDWTSKLFITPKPTNFGFAQVLVDETVSDLAAQVEDIAASNAALWASGGDEAGWNDADVDQYEWNGSQLVTVPTLEDSNVTLFVYADDELVATRSVSNGLIVKLPSGFKSSHWQVRVSGNKGVRRITLAHSAREISAT